MYMTPPEAALRLGYSDDKVLRMLADGRLAGLPGLTRHAHGRVLRAAVEAMAAEQENRPMSAWLRNRPGYIWSSRLGAALLILDHPKVRAAAHPNVHFDPEWIDWAAIREELAAEADLALVDAAQTVYDGSADVGLGRLLMVLNGQRLLRVVLAVQVWLEAMDHWEAFRILTPRRRARRTARVAGPVGGQSPASRLA